jgi:hypothetical protein
VMLAIDLPLGFIPGDHAASVYATAYICNHARDEGFTPSRTFGA